MTSPGSTTDKYAQIIAGIAGAGGVATSDERRTPLGGLSPRRAKNVGEARRDTLAILGYVEEDVPGLLRGMPPERIALIQRQMQAGGLLPENFRASGLVDNSTRAAFGELLTMANLGGTRYQQVLSQFGSGNVSATELRKELADQKRQLELSFTTRLNTYDRSDPATLRQTAEAAFQQALGRKPKQGEMDSFVTAFLEREQQSQKTVFDAQDAIEYDERGRARTALDGSPLGIAAGAGGATAGPEGIDAFMQAMSAQESGGNYNAKNGRTGASGRFQIMPSNWGPWSKEAGLGAGAARTPENQDRVARFKMQQYYDQFGSWDAVAVAWYAGPGAVKGYLENPNTSRYTRKQGKGNEPSINEYVQSVMGRLGTAGGTVTSASAGAPKGGKQGVLAAVQAASGSGGSGGSRGKQGVLAAAAEVGAGDLLWQRLQQMIADAPGQITPGPRTRDYATQVRLWERYKSGKGPLAAKPGTSKHTDGRANDLKYENAATKRWALQNAHRYGLSFPLLNAGEDWHVELAGGHSAGDGHAHGGAAPVSTDVTVQRQDAGAQALETARNANPVETRAYDVGQQFQNMLSIMSRGVIA